MMICFNRQHACFLTSDTFFVCYLNEEKNIKYTWSRGLFINKNQLPFRLVINLYNTELTKHTTQAQSAGDEKVVSATLKIGGHDLLLLRDYTYYIKSMVCDGVVLQYTSLALHVSHVSIDLSSKCVWSVSSQHHAQQTRDVGPLVGQCWSSVYDAGPTLDQHWAKVSCMLGGFTGAQRHDTLGQRLRPVESLCTTLPHTAGLSW